MSRGQGADALVIPQDLRDRQGMASNPELSAWVSANAGAGKTYVLTRRVTRLLLGGAEPSRILCLTFTKAAAANMANRVFGDLEAWAKASDEELRESLSPFILDPDAQDLARARRLFARAIETPGGLKVQTIHAFCEGLLQAFPFEANVPASFQVMDEVQTREMLARARDTVMTRTDATEDAFAEALQALAMERAPGSLAEHLDAAVATRRGLASWLGSEDPAGRLRQGLGLDGALSREALLERLDASEALPVALWREASALLNAGSTTLRTMAMQLDAALGAAGAARMEAYTDVFLTKTTRTIPARFLTKEFRATYPDWTDRLEREARHAEELHGLGNAIALAERSQALFTLAGGIIAVFEREKARRGLMEFQDLIDHAGALLAPEGNRWVLYKLDGGLDHVLLDEAQDTSPAQWTIIQNLTDEFFGAEAEASSAAGGQQGRRRTLFAVGDEKQSIFSFQGARPATFETERARIATAAEAAKHRFETVPIETSFRSAPNILKAVDAVFAADEMHADLTAKGFAPHHESARPNAPSFVELWAPTLPSENVAERAWDAPLDQRGVGEPSDVMATRIANQIAALMAGGMPAGEILVLVRGRNRAFEAVIRALRAAHVPVAGADRLKLLEQIAILDCLALADALLLPDDDLALATILKSPLFDFADAEMDAETRLFNLAHGRDGRLWNALVDRARTDPVCARALARLEMWASRAAYARPFEFFAEVLGAGGGRRAFLARLGLEAGDALDEFLSLALAFEERATPTLQAFVHDLRKTEREVKRELSEAGETVRVMTVHNAKGLEAKAVFLVCAGQKIMDGSKDPDIFALDDAPDAPLVYAPSAQQDPAPIAAIRSAHRQARAAEERRLLYVAMTRAKNYLYVVACRSGKAPKDTEPALMPDGETWHGMVARALGEAAVEGTCEGSGLPNWVWPVRPVERPEAWHTRAPDPVTVDEVSEAPWLTSRVSPEAPRRETTPSGIPHAGKRRDPRAPSLSPSAAPTIPGLDALLRGTLLHRLLQSLPPLARDARPGAARAYLTARAPGVGEAARTTLFEEAVAVIDHADLADVFGPHAAAEVDIVGHVARGEETLLVNGRIDRLVVLPDRVIIVDFKTDALPAETVDSVAPTYLAQLAAYRDLIRQAYPDRAVECRLVWTTGARVMTIPEALLNEAAGDAESRAA